ncbi:hypothetical protein KEJ39_03320 [Candidatus Bathyarchaeota archaeon]|nr:hypothetical protein [Candidatus Bathyarchaeota archaeon]
MAIYPPLETSFEDTPCMFDQYSDSRGLRPYPWGFEVWGGKPAIYCDSPLAHDGKKSVQLIGNNLDDMVVIAIPELRLKPRIIPGKTYRVEAWVKMEDVGGNGVRLMQQFFNSSEIYIPRYRCFGEFVRGSTDWFKLTLDSRIDDPEMIRGDPVLQFWGIGTVWIDSMRFYEIPALTPKLPAPAPPRLTLHELSTILAAGESAVAAMRLTVEGSEEMFLQDISFAGEKSGWIRIDDRFAFNPSGRTIDLLIHIPPETRPGTYTINVSVTSLTEKEAVLTTQNVLNIHVVESISKPTGSEKESRMDYVSFLSVLAGVLVLFTSAFSYVVWKRSKSPSRDGENRS